MGQARQRLARLEVLNARIQPSDAIAVPCLTEPMEPSFSIFLSQQESEVVPMASQIYFSSSTSSLDLLLGLLLGADLVVGQSLLSFCRMS
jgi:hypothetical protein